MVNAAILRLSHCQTALFGNRGGGSGGGGLLPVVSLSPAREECSEPAAGYIITNMYVGVNFYSADTIRQFFNNIHALTKAFLYISTN